MNILIIDHIENAYRNLRRSRARTALTTLGIAIGVASVTTILALSSGINSMLSSQIEDIRGTLMIVRPGLQTRDPNVLTSPIAQQTFSTSTLTEDDISLLQEMDGIAQLAPIMTIDGTITSAKTSIRDSVIVATTGDYAAISDLKIRYGQFLDGTTDDETAVIGYQLAVDLFGTDRPLGQTFTLRGKQFTVIGVLAKSSHHINYNNVDANYAAFVNFNQGKLFHQGRSQIQQINIRTENAEGFGRVRETVNKQLLDKHLGEHDFTILSGEDIIKPTSQLFTALTRVMAAIAAISLIVGGIGVMNIMLVGVAERTREIGIRKAVGATNGSIVMQFLIESLMISFLGGFLGYILGYLLAFTISLFLYFIPTFTWWTLGAAIVMSIIVGVSFGLYPALRAARKDTIESLRQYH